MDEGDWNKNKLIGNIAENIVEMMINSMPDWKCNKFGVETHIRDIKDLVRKSKNPIAIKIRKMPDFVAFNEKTGETLFIEVKYSSNFDRKNYFIEYLENYNKYWKGTKLIIVRSKKPHFLYIDLEKIKNSMRKIKAVDEGWRTTWDFREIEQDIKDLFPDLKDEYIEEAISRLKT